MSDKEKMPVSILDIAIARGAETDKDGSINGGEFEKLGLPFFGGCAGCGASIAAYNMYPTNRGYVACKDCVGDHGFATVEEFEKETA